MSNDQKKDNTLDDVPSPEEDIPETDGTHPELDFPDEEEGSVFMRVDEARKVIAVEKHQATASQTEEDTDSIEEELGVEPSIEIDQDAVKAAQVAREEQREQSRLQFKRILKEQLRQEAALAALERPPQRNDFIYKVISLFFKGSIIFSAIYLFLNGLLNKGHINWDFIGQYLILLFFAVGAKRYSSHMEALARSYHRRVHQSQTVGEVKKSEKQKTVNELSVGFAHWLLSIFNWALVVILFTQDIRQAAVSGGIISTFYFALLVFLSRLTGSKANVE